MDSRRFRKRDDPKKFDVPTLIQHGGEGESCRSALLSSEVVST
jgi:hypothetical protein